MALSAILAATHDFMPDFVFRGSSLAGWHTLGHANWRAENGEITGRPETTDGGWLVMDKSYQDVDFYTEFRCAEKCDAGVLLRTEKTPEGGWKGVYIPVSGEGGSYDLTLGADGKELRIPRDGDQRAELKPIGCTVVVRNGDRHEVGTMYHAAFTWTRVPTVRLYGS